jgi:hypothetical protein
MTSLHKAEVLLYGIKSKQTLAEPGLVTRSGRWAIVGLTKYKKKTWSVVHVPTGLAARNDLSQVTARALALAFEELDTPTLDACGFGPEYVRLPAPKEDLRKLVLVMKELLKF